MNRDAIKRILGLKKRLQKIAGATRTPQFYRIVITDGNRGPHRRVCNGNFPTRHIVVGREWLRINTTTEEKTALAMRKLERSAKNLHDDNVL